MILEKVGPVTEGFYALGIQHMPSYLLDAAKPAMFDSGITCLGPRYVAEAPKFLAGRTPRFLFLTHAHFDHCGSASQIKAAFPDLEICASELAAGILAKPRAVDLITQLNRGALQMAKGLAGPDDVLSAADFAPVTIDRVLADGDSIDLGGATVQVLATPGHTRDFLSYYIPEKRILIASESAGCPDASGYLRCEFLADYQAYLESQRRLVELDVDIVCPGHIHIYLGEDARDYLRRALQATLDFKTWVDRLLDEEQGDVEKVVARIKEVEYDHLPSPKQLESAYLLNCRARVAHLAGLREA